MGATFYNVKQNTKASVTLNFLAIKLQFTTDTKLNISLQASCRHKHTIKNKTTTTIKSGWMLRSAIELSVSYEEQ